MIIITVVVIEVVKVVLIIRNEMRRFKDDYLESIKGIREKLIRRTSPGGLLFVGEMLKGINFSPKMVSLL